MRLRHLTATATAVGLTLAGLVGAAPTAAATSPDVVINEVYGGGGGAAAVVSDDFIELYNRGSAPVSLDGWSVQYQSSAGSTWQRTVLEGSIAPGGTFLIGEGGGSGGAPLPTPNVAGGINMSASSAKVALVSSDATLTCAKDCVTADGVRDYVGYGAADRYEGTAAAPTLDATTSAARTDGVDTDDNAADFTKIAPTPRPGAIVPTPAPTPDTTIAQVQGVAHRSPLEGSTVTVEGVVTATTSSGFWLQSTSPDNDPATSEGLFVYKRAVVRPGDVAVVKGEVSEYRPGGATSGNLTTTELTSASVYPTGQTAALPAPVVLGGPDGRHIPAVIEDDASGSVETTGVFDPADDAIDFFESLEGMRVQVTDPKVVGPTNRYGELTVLPAGVDARRTSRGGVLYRYDDPAAARIHLDNMVLDLPKLDVGDAFAGPVLGVLDYQFGNPRLEVTDLPATVDNGLAREQTRAPAAGELAVATFNVENLDPTDPPSKFADLAQVVVDNLAAPDLIAVEEVQDNDGAAKTGVTAADVTWQMLIDAIAAKGGPAYQFRDIAPANLADGGEPGGNIRVGFLFRTDRGLSFVDRPGGDATTTVKVVRGPGGQPALTVSPGRIDPTNPAWEDSRKPLAGEFRYHNRPLFVVANHFNSKGGDNPLFGVTQPPVRSSEQQRHAQAQVVHDFVASIERLSPLARVIVLGDLNDFEFSATANILTSRFALVDLPRLLPPAERYTYVYEGASQVLDHILLSPGLLIPVPARGWPGWQKSFDYDIVHVNAEFSDQVSDHDPQVVRLTPR